MAHILVVDDEEDIRLLLRDILSDEGYQISISSTAEEALSLSTQHQFDLIVMDVWLENSSVDGLELLTQVKTLDPSLPIVMISGHSNIEMAVNAIKHGAYDFIEKPFQSDTLLLTVNRALEAAQLRRENALLRQSTGKSDTIIGQSPIMRDVLNQLQKVAITNSRVLIMGPPGSGKEVAARKLHNLSQRAQAPFIVLNCAAMHPDSLEEALFGQEKPQENYIKPGLLEQAHHGTLLLDEVADMPLPTQAKMLRLLQEQRFMRLGGQKVIEVDVRIIAASAKDLQSEIQQQNFREELYYRLSVVPITIPPLQKRFDDIPLLLNYFMELASASQGLPARRFDEQALAALQAYDWPGNVRQLRNVIDWLLIMNSDRQEGEITKSDLPSEISGLAAESLPAQQKYAFMNLPLRKAREEFEREYLQTQIGRFDGNISKTAAFIGMERSALHRKLKSLGLSPGEKDELTS